ncbi:hypothetical protein ACWGNF_34235 [Streptomyces sp. NPDC055808]
MTAAHGDAGEGGVGAFVDASARLTGFGAEELSALGMAETYRAVVVTQAARSAARGWWTHCPGPGPR